MHRFSTLTFRIIFTYISSLPSNLFCCGVGQQMGNVGEFGRFEVGEDVVVDGPLLVGFDGGYCEGGLESLEVEGGVLLFWLAEIEFESFLEKGLQV